jgi:DHA1 family bicyclomycin/chloramphenicol resistance-like MFS transporter
MRTDSRLFTFFLGSIAALTSLSIDMSLPTVPAIERGFGQAAGRGGLTMSLFLAGYALTPLIGGPLADRLGRRPVLLASLALFGISACACGVSTSFEMLLVFRLLQGCASGVSTTLPLAIVRDLLGGSAARQRISEVTTINNIMPLVAPIVGSWVMLLGSWRLLFATQGVFAAGIALALLLNFKETLPPERRRRLHPSALIRNYWHILTNRIFLGFAIINGLTFACMFSFLSVSPLILMQRMGVTRAAYPLMFAALGCGTILGALMSARLNRRHAPVRGIITSGLILMTTSSVIATALQMAGFHRPAAILPLVFATLLGFGLASPSITIEALGPIPNLAGSGSGALRSILMIFGSGASGFLAIFCARHFMHAEVATTLTMSGTAITALVLYATFLRNQHAQ